MRRPLIAVLGPTASGKSAVAMALARSLRGEILSVDSMQVYRGMDIGTAKPTAAEREEIRHHMLDLVEPEEEFSVAEFQRRAREVADRAAGPVIVTGGSGLHFRALVDPLEFAPHDAAVRAEVEALDPDSAAAELVRFDARASEHVDLGNPRRVARALEILRLTGETPSRRAARPAVERVAAYRPLLPFTAVGIDAGDEVAPRARARLATMIESGLLAEVSALSGRLGRTASQAVGYRQLVPVIDGGLALEEGVRLAERATLGLARRQRTYFRRDPRIRWLEWTGDREVLAERAMAVLGLETAWTS